MDNKPFYIQGTFWLLALILGCATFLQATNNLSDVMVNLFIGLASFGLGAKTALTVPKVK